ncbi:MAG: transposase [Deltaproteobacteria bacterium]|nr:transposase [Deltaproteobacteria bacterium]
MADNGYMPRLPRRLLVNPHHPHHVILRGNNRRRLFSYPHERHFFLDRLLQGSEKQRVPVHATTLMTNHIHLIVTPCDHLQLSRFVRHFAQRYAQFRNASRGATGKLFEQRYRCIPIVSDEQMAITTAYVELNPVRANICAEPEAYRWSSYPLHAGYRSDESLISKLWSPSSWYQSLGSGPNERAAAFRDWFAYYRDRDDWSQVYPDRRPRDDRKRFERPDRSGAT